MAAAPGWTTCPLGACSPRNTASKLSTQDSSPCRPATEPPRPPQHGEHAPKHGWHDGLSHRQWMATLWQVVTAQLTGCSSTACPWARHHQTSPTGPPQHGEHAHRGGGGLPLVLPWFQAVSTQWEPIGPAGPQPVHHPGDPKLDHKLGYIKAQVSKAVGGLGRPLAWLHAVARPSQPAQAVRPQGGPHPGSLPLSPQGCHSMGSHAQGLWGGLGGCRPCYSQCPPPHGDGFTMLQEVSRGESLTTSLP